MAAQPPDVPVAFHGVWARKLLATTKDGSTDTTTRVFWLQTSSLFGDLRIPAPPPAEGLGGLGQATTQQLIELATQDGFAGVTELQEEAGGRQIMTWHRELHFRPESAQTVDAGAMTFADPEALREEGLDGSYWEEWRRLPESKGPTWGFRLAPATVGDAPVPERRGFLLGAGDCFLFAADRREPWSVDASTAGLTDEDRRCILDIELSFGRISGGAVQWEILHSTLPGRVGKPLLAPHVAFRHLWKGVYGAGGKLLAGRYPPEFGWQLLDGFHSFEPEALETPKKAPGGAR